MTARWITIHGEIRCACCAEYKPARSKMVLFTANRRVSYYCETCVPVNPLVVASLETAKESQCTVMA